jgi:hypothetical protein
MEPLMKSRLLASLFLIPLTISVLHADVTLRYRMEVKMNPSLPAPLVAAAMKGIESAAPQDMALSFRNGKGYSSSSAGFNSFTDFTAGEVTLLDTAGKRYSKLKSDQFAASLAGAMPQIPADATNVLASMKTHVSPARLTGRTAVIEGVEAEEHEIVFSMDGPAMPNMPPAPMMKMVMQLWTAKQSEVLRVPAIRELTGYTLYAYATTNPMASVEGMLKQLPGFSDAIESLTKEMQNGTPMLRMHIDQFMPAIAAMMRQMPAGANNPFGANFDADAPLMQMNEEAVELSSAPVLDSLFQIPAGYQEAPAADLIKSMFAKSTAAVKP